MLSQDRKGVRNPISTVPDTFQGRAVKPHRGQETQPSLWRWQAHGLEKILSKAVVALLPLTILARSVRTPPDLQIPPPWPSTVPFAWLPLTLLFCTVTVLFRA
jgi:hypothetical protein